MLLFELTLKAPPSVVMTAGLLLTFAIVRDDLLLLLVGCRCGSTGSADVDDADDEDGEVDEGGE